MKDDVHIPYKKGKKLVGTATYTSVYTHLGIGFLIIRAKQKRRHGERRLCSDVLFGRNASVVRCKGEDEEGKEQENYGEQGRKLSFEGRE